MDAVWNHAYGQSEAEIEHLPDPSNCRFGKANLECHRAQALHPLISLVLVSSQGYLAENKRPHLALPPKPSHRPNVIIMLGNLKRPHLTSP